ncbi:ABC transporter ATP-binding protein, partial [candidate division KSB1 bacterium]|nr:ABC transporter ATP-binding protein [candidate division KSB1 bacterium]NIR71842.1 ABC transporter ATP-binding protein [candidate division KSB1 bacterium]NIS25358.1 ABC transporter ATP-binding protein [candidate division KSB1 bacterium]NIT71828.1 ABC transporter ATP-binding protein [candidate division KSB1 bacterium]NIU25566.1 ABC transporter ATP-binding protein [candidate division KSB1 bacterium]
MKRLLSFLGPYKGFVALAVLVLFLASLTQLSGPFLTKIGIDEYIANEDFQGLNFICLIFLVVLIFEFVLQFVQTYLINWIGQRAMFDMRSRLFSHLQTLPVSFFDRNPVGRLVTRVTTDVESLHQMLSSGVVAIFGDVFKLIGIVIILLAMNWRLALVTFAVLPVLFYLSFLFKKKVRSAYRLIRVRIARINAFLQENITGMAVVQIFNRERKNFERFDKLNHDHLDAFLKTIFYYALFYPGVRILSAVAIALIIWYGGGRILEGMLTFGALVAFIQYAEMFFRPIMDLSEKYNIMQSAMASSERIFGLLDTKPEMGAVGIKKQLRTAKGEIEFRDVWFAYKEDEYVLKDISFKVKPGEKVAFVGATGAGKTTIMNLLLRFYELQRGEIFLDGVNIKEMDAQELRSHFSMVLQDVFVFDGTVADNIRLGNSDITDAELEQATSDVHADYFIQKLEQKYDQPVQERGKSLSVGQRQLLAFARALAFDPAVLILDEATSSVDTETETLIQDALKRLMQGRTSLVVAHRLSTVQNSDRIIVLHKGEIREEGTHQELLTQEGIYYRLYQLQYAFQEKEQR